MTDYLPYAEVHKGDRFAVDINWIEVVRCSAAGWVDVRINNGHSLWSKRMPNGIPADWERIT